MNTSDNVILFSFVMATYNSEATILEALTSIRGQDFPQKQIEIIVVDGGSTDKTLEIARRFHARILANPKRVPEAAKVIGFFNAHGKYVCIMDSDEVICQKNILLRRYQLLEAHPDLHLYCGGPFQTPTDSPACCYYINAVGDPFTCFVYRTYKRTVLQDMLLHAVWQEKGDGDGYVAHYSEDEIKPIGDTDVTFDRCYVLDHYSTLLQSSTTTAVFDQILSEIGGGQFGFITSDCNLHYSRSGVKTYFKKLRFRVINNVHDISGSGYSYKAQSHRLLRQRKYYYPLYCASLILPIIDAFRMVHLYGHWIFFLHPVFAWYVLLQIVIQEIFKVIGKKVHAENYG